MLPRELESKRAISRELRGEPVRPPGGEGKKTTRESEKEPPFQEELRLLLEKHGVEYDERYLWT